MKIITFLWTAFSIIYRIPSPKISYSALSLNRSEMKWQESGLCHNHSFSEWTWLTGFFSFRCRDCVQCISASFELKYYLPCLHTVCSWTFVRLPRMMQACMALYNVDIVSSIHDGGGENIVSNERKTGIGFVGIFETRN